MTDQGERYDRMAAGYEQWWAPVLAPSALGLLDRMAEVLGVADAQVIDIGAGTGNLALPALQRWPTLRVTAIDASREMLGALQVMVADLPPGERDRFEGAVAFAAELPYADASFDVAMSSFVLQLVPNRAKALREIRRVLRPGGTLGYVTWLTDRTVFAPDRLFDGLLAEFGYDDEPGDGRSGDVPSATVAVAELRRAGFREASAEVAELAYAFTVESYIGFLVDFDEETLFEGMGRAERRRFLARLREGLMALPADALVFRAPIVYASGRRSDG
ncbi:MAG: class I SAM-dependent methyltransferase [Candidatus Limnocylindrales bacterium]